MKRESIFQTVLIQFLHAPLLILIGFFFLPNLQTISGWDQGTYLSLTLIGHFGVLAFLPLLVLFPASCFVSSKRMIFVSGILNIFLVSTLLLDSMVFSLYRFHINGFVLSMIFGGAATDIFRFSLVDFTKVSFAIAFVAAVEASLIWLAIWLMNKQAKIGKKIAYSFLFFFCLMTYGHLRHAFAFASYQSKIVAVSRNFPLYFPLTASKQLYNSGLVDFEKVRELSHTQRDVNETGDLNIPLNPLELHVPEKKLNVLWVVIDALRADAMTEKIMPNAWEYSRKSSRYMYHRSGSNGTRGGIFSLFYGFPSTYWDSVFSQKGALWVKTLLEHNYDLGIFASAPIFSPEFDKTVFFDVKNLRVQTTRNGAKAPSGWESDEWAFEDWKNHLEARDAKQPFFDFLFFDAVHAKDHPPGHQPFLPAAKQATYVGLNNNSDITDFLNLYYNSVHYNDALFKRVLDELKAKNLLENTVVVFTSDHGEEFNDNKQNYWGHNGNFSDAQLHVPLWIYWPGKPPAEFTHATTHYDIVPTMLSEVFGMKNPASDVSFGKLLDDVSEPLTWHLAGSALNFAIIEPDQMMVKFATGQYEMYDSRMKPLPDSAFRSQTVGKALDKMRRYYK